MCSFFVVLVLAEHQLLIICLCLQASAEVLGRIGRFLANTVDQTSPSLGWK